MKNKNLAPKCDYQKVWKILLSNQTEYLFKFLLHSYKNLNFIYNWLGLQEILIYFLKILKKLLQNNKFVKSWKPVKGLKYKGPYHQLKKWKIMLPLHLPMEDTFMMGKYWIWKQFMIARSKLRILKTYQSSGLKIYLKSNFYWLIRKQFCDVVF